MLRTVSHRLHGQCRPVASLLQRGHPEVYDELIRCNWNQLWSMPLRLMASRPPHTELTMPALSPTMSQGNIAAWMVKEGDEIAPGDILCDVETDKATMAWENQDDGFIAKLLKPSGSQDIPVGTPLAILVEDGEHVAAFADYKAEDAQSSATDDKPSEGGPVTAQASHQQSGSSESDSSKGSGSKPSGKMGPAARVLLEEHGLSPDDVIPSGPQDIITKGDVLAAIANGTDLPKKAQQQQQQQPSKPQKQATKEESSDSHPETAAAQKDTKQPQSRRQESAPRQPAQTGDSKIRMLLAKQLLAEGNKIPPQWLKDWTARRQVES